MTFGQMPIANGFLSEKNTATEYFFELEVAHCPKCNAVQLPHQPEKEKMFHTEYPFFSGTSKSMQTHFADFADSVNTEYLAKLHDPFVIEIGCNDGILIKNFLNLGYRHLGIDPSANVADVARSKGVDVITSFFDITEAARIIKSHGQADLFLAANVMCHLSNINSVVEGIQRLLKPTGILVFEEPYLGEVIETTAYDQLYDEHVFLFSAHSVKFLFEQFEMELIDIAPQPTHGGSMRYTVAHKGQHSVTQTVTQQLQKETLLGLCEPSTYKKFKESCEKSRDQLVSLLESIAKRGETVAGYAATSKSTTVLNYCGIGSSLVSYICDTTPIKHSRLSPGMHIPVRPDHEFHDDYPDYALLFAYNHKNEIFQKEKAFSKQGGRWILYVPEVITL
jgi:methylation protein EvaC